MEVLGVLGCQPEIVLDATFAFVSGSGFIEPVGKPHLDDVFNYWDRVGSEVCFETLEGLVSLT